MRTGHWITACALIASLAASTADAETYPARTVTFLTPFSAGSATDAVARVIAQALQEQLGQPFVVENRAGAGGLLSFQHSGIRSLEFT